MRACAPPARRHTAWTRAPIAWPAVAAATALLLSLPQAASATPRTRREASASYEPDKVVVGYTTSSPKSITAIAAASGASGGGETISTEAETGTQVGIEAPLAAGAASVRLGRSLTVQQTRVLTLRQGVSVQQAIARLQRLHGVAWALPDYVARASSIEEGASAPAPSPASGAPSPASGAPKAEAPSEGQRSGREYIPNDPGNTHIAGGWRRLQWNFAGRWGVKAPEAWANLRADGAPGGKGVIVAVLDTGIAYANSGEYLRSPDFTPGQFVKGYDFVSNDPYPYDRNGHGTFVAGEIAEATNNHKDLTGLAYGVKLMPVRVLDASGEGDASTIAKGVRYAASHGANVINLSLEFAGEVTAADVPELTSALAYAHRRGVVIVAAAGNEDSTVIPYPARDRRVIAVGASTEHGCLASYSNYGKGIALVAPGGGADATLPGDPNCVARPGSGRDIYQVTFKGSSPDVFGMPGGYEGTSMAAPEVSATAALIIASGVLGPRPTPAAVRARLTATASPLGSAADHLDYGHGLLNAGAATAPGGPGAIAAGRRRSARRASRGQRSRQRGLARSAGSARRSR